MLILGAIVFLLGYLVGRDNSKSPGNVLQSQGLQRIINALVFTAQKEQGLAKSKTTNEALQRVIDAGYAEQYGVAPGAHWDQNKSVEPVVAQHSPAPAGAPVQAAANQTQYVAGPNLVQQTPAKQDLDNTSLMLYFGAFLFITSIGLFVGFSDIDGVAKTVLVAVLAGAMYMFGVWLYDNKKKLHEVGLTFVAIGMSALPFVGMAAYYYVYDEQYGPAIWLATSVVTMMVYLLSLFRFRNTFISYMLIASIISLFEASVSVVDAPAYYFVWMLIAVGIVLQFVSLYSEKLPEFKDASSQSARLIVPLTLLASLFIVGSEGYWQLSVSLLLGASYYLLQFFVAIKDRWYYSMGSHALFVLGVSLGAFAVNESLNDLSGALLLIGIVHLAIISLVKDTGNLIYTRFTDIALLSAITAILTAVESSTLVTVAFIALLIIGAIVTARTKRHDSFVITVAAWVISSVIIGQVLPDDSLSSLAQAVLSFTFVIPLALLLFDSQIRKMPRSWADTVKAGIISLHAISIIFSYVHGEYSVLLFSSLAAVTAIGLGEALRTKEWVEIAVIYTLAPFGYVVLALSDSYLRDLPLFTWSVVVALVFNISISLLYKLESSRWVSTAAWLSLPFALGIEEIGAFRLEETQQMWLYLAAAIALSISRAIARGRLLASKDATLASLARESSTSYELGLAAAAIVATILAFVSTDSVAQSTLVIMLAGLIATAGGTIIERTPQYVAVIPVVLQLALLRILEPYDSSGWLASNDFIVHAYVLLSSMIAIAIYGWTTTAQMSDHNKTYLESIRNISISTLFIAPLSFLILGSVVWAMPVTLIIAAGVLLHYQWDEGVTKREGVGYIGLLGVFWLMYMLGVENIQAYTHVLAALFGLYGYLRYIAKDQIKSNEYMGYMLGAATIPLALQALSGGDNADLYGIWLLLESVVFFLVGITIRNQLVTRWGLYVAVGSVLYQLRGLGWAMLSVLALFIIGVAAYRALNQPDDPPQS